MSHTKMFTKMTKVEVSKINQNVMHAVLKAHVKLVETPYGVWWKRNVFDFCYFIQKNGKLCHPKSRFSNAERAVNRQPGFRPGNSPSRHDFFK